MSSTIHECRKNIINIEYLDTGIVLRYFEFFKKKALSSKRYFFPRIWQGCAKKIGGLRNLIATTLVGLQRRGRRQHNDEGWQVK
jgi:hypothetical protein